SPTTNISVLDYSTDKSNDRIWGLSALAWVQIVLVSVLMCALFRFNLARLWGKTNPINGQDSNWQHSIFVPLIGLYYLYIHREELLRAALAPVRQYKSIRILACIGLAMMVVLALQLWLSGETGFALYLLGLLAAGLAVPVALPTAAALGSVLLFEGLIVFAFGIFPGQNDYVKDLGMVITIFGVATLLCGWSVMKVAWFPIVFLVVALPWPELVYAKLAWPLQKLAASVAVGTLRAFGVEAQNFGTRIMMEDKDGNQRLLNVAEACAGLKSVMTFLMVAGTVAFLGSRALWEKAVLTLSAIPIAIFCNVMRVSGQGLLDRYGSHEWSEGFAHQFAGLVMLIPGFFMILIVGWILEKLFIEEVDRNELAIAGAAAKAGRTKRVIVEVPRKREAGTTPAIEATTAPVEPAAVRQTIAEPGVPAVTEAATVPAPSPVTPPSRVAPPAIVPAPAPVAKRPLAKPAAAASAPVAAPPTSTLKPSTLKPSPVKDRLPTAAPTAPAASTLKPSSKPVAAPRSTTPAPISPPSTLKPSTLKPSTPKPRADVPQQSPGSLKPQPASSPVRPSSRTAAPSSSNNVNQEGTGRA
ncbi:MAG: exosortase, partial [Phycisphaerales bacterium]|nr:exosortase [Phycisphaerales bacterium]